MQYLLQDLMKLSLTERLMIIETLISNTERGDILFTKGSWSEISRHLPVHPITTEQKSFPNNKK